MFIIMCISCVLKGSAVLVFCSNCRWLVTCHILHMFGVWFCWFFIFRSACGSLGSVCYCWSGSTLEQRKLTLHMDNAVFWDVTPCCSHKNRRARNNFSSNWQPNHAACFGCQLLLTLSLAHRFLSPWWWRRYFPLKRRFLNEPQGVASNKTTFFIVIALETSNLTNWCMATARYQHKKEPRPLI
jgi:hypothetical protein